MATPSWGLSGGNGNERAPRQEPQVSGHREEQASAPPSGSRRGADGAHEPLRDEKKYGGRAWASARGAGTGNPRVALSPPREGTAAPSRCTPRRAPRAHGLLERSCGQEVPAC